MRPYPFPIPCDPPTRWQTGATAAAVRQRGWSLLEGALATALMGLIAVAVLSTLEAAGRQEIPAEAEQYLARAEDALLGFALTRFHLPEPLDAMPSPGHPGVVEGWLPAAALGLSGSQPVRYRVDGTLTRLPSMLYRADPLRLAGNLIEPRHAANGVDFCVALLWGGGRVPAGGGEVQPGLVLQAIEADSRPLPGRAPAVTRSRGHGELASRLGCIEKLSAIAAAVKATVVAADLAALAAQRVDFRRLLAAAARQSQANLEWQEANLAASMTRYSLEQMLVTMQMKTKAVEMTKSIATMVTIATAMAGNAISISQAREGLAGAGRKIAQAGRMLDLALLHLQEMDALAAGSAVRSNRLLAGN